MKRGINRRRESTARSARWITFGDRWDVEVAPGIGAQWLYFESDATFSGTGGILVLSNVVSYWLYSHLGLQAGLVLAAGLAHNGAPSDGYIEGAQATVATAELHLGGAYAW